MAKRVKILVVGDLMLDHYIWGSCDRISPEAPVQVVKINNENYTLGGAGNVVRNLLSLGANVSVASVLGDDEAGKKIKERLAELNVKDELILTEKGRESSIKSRIMASHQQVVRIDKERSPITPHRDVPLRRLDRLSDRLGNHSVGLYGLLHAPWL